MLKSRSMDPNSPSNYLDQISSQQKTATMSPYALWGIIGAVLLVAIGAILILTQGGGDSASQKFTNLIYRVQALEKLTKSNTKTIQNSKLLAANSSLNSILTGIDKQSDASLKVYGLQKLPTTPNDSPITKEYADITSKLDNARLNVAFDDTYAREVTYQIKLIRSEMSSLYNQSRSSTVKTFLQQSDTNLQPLLTAFSNL